MKMPNNIELLRVINNTNESDYELVSEYSRVDECCEVVRINSFEENMPKPYIIKDKIYFGTKKSMNPFYVAKFNGNKFSLFELSLKKYTELGF